MLLVLHDKQAANEKYPTITEIMFIQTSNSPRSSRSNCLSKKRNIGIKDNIIWIQQIAMKAVSGPNKNYIVGAQLKNVMTISAIILFSVKLSLIYANNGSAFNKERPKHRPKSYSLWTTSGCILNRKTIKPKNKSTAAAAAFFYFYIFIFYNKK